ncbi:hypothetical protein ACFOGI_11440 [Virgibacillus xinjiangensis]|uniref:Uncharacterized protein n=1 Tax=Virgibacillus xinjiangensis TaxID=393090 RepID=A0ABV7CX16_9BACI
MEICYSRLDIKQEMCFKSRCGNTTTLSAGDP